MKERSYSNATFVMKEGILFNALRVTQPSQQNVIWKNITNHSTKEKVKLNYLFKVYPIES